MKNAIIITQDIVTRIINNSHLVDSTKVQYKKAIKNNMAIGIKIRQKAKTR